MPTKDTSSPSGRREAQSNIPLPTVGAPQDGRHLLDVVEEQQYSGKPFVQKEQDQALGEMDEGTRLNKPKQ